MDWKQFIAEMADALAWPTIAAIALIIYRKNVGGFIDRIEHYKFWGQEATLGKTLKDSRPDAVALTKPAEDSVEATPESALVNAVRFSPAGSVATAFIRIEKTLIALRERTGMEPRSNLRTVMTELQRRGFIDEHSMRLFKSLYDVRNLVIHGEREISANEALEFSQQASVLAENLERLSRMLHGDPLNQEKAPS